MPSRTTNKLSPEVRERAVIGNIPPAEAEAAYSAQLEVVPLAA